MENRNLFEFDDVRVDARNRAVTRNGALVRLPPKAFDAFVLLLRAAPDAVPRESLRAVLWGDTVVEDTALAQTVYLVRKVLGSRPDGTPYIETVPKLGYRFTATPKELPRNPPDRASTAELKSGRARPWPPILAAICLLAAAAAVALVSSRARPPVNPESDRLYRHAMALWRQRRGFTDTDERELRQAIRLQPDFARAHAGLAAVLALRSSSAEANAEVAKALALDPRLADAHAVLGFIRLVHDWDWRAAETSLHQALEFEPDNQLALQWSGLYLGLEGRHGEADRVLTRAVALYPDSMNLLDQRCAALYWARRFADAAKSCEQAIEVGPDFLFAREHLALVYAALGRFREAGAMETGAVVGISPGHVTDAAQWQARFDEAASRNGAQGFFDTVCTLIGGNHWFRMAQCKAGLGERQAALEWLERGVQQHAFHSVFIEAEPLFEPLHGDARFEKLVRLVGPPR